MPSSPRVPIFLLTLWLVSTLFWWALAFFPVPSTAPEWLTVARDVCFGTLNNGLPGPSGWMVLVLGPLSFLLTLMVIWRTEATQALRAMMNLRAGRVALVFAFVAVGVEAAWVGNKIRTGLAIQEVAFGAAGDESLPTHYPRSQSLAPDFSLIDQHGNTLRLNGLKGKTVLLTFAFAHCQTVCPTLVKESLEAVNGLKPERLKILIVTLDPWRDTPKSLPFLAEKWKLPRHAHVLSGPVDEVVRVLEKFKVPFQRDEKNGDVAHPALTYLISADGELAYTFNNAPSSWLREAIGRLETMKDVKTARQTL